MSLTILFGSETGSAQELSERLARECYLRNLSPRLYAMDDYELVRS